MVGSVIAFYLQYFLQLNSESGRESTVLVIYIAECFTWVESFDAFESIYIVDKGFILSFRLLEKTFSNRNLFPQILILLLYFGLNKLLVI